MSERWDSDVHEISQRVPLLPATRAVFPRADPPTQAEMQAIANKIDELINALRR